MSVGTSTRRYVIVGNGFAGTTAAEQLRKHDPSCTIALFTDEPYPLYNRIALPPMLRKQVTEPKVMMRDQAWHDNNNIDLHLRTRVEKIVPEEKIVIAHDRSYPYDALLIATGGRPNPHPALGREAANVLNFQYLDETRAISEVLETTKSAVSIGGSFIAYELAEAFTSRKVETHWVMRGPRFLHRMLDEVAGQLIDDAARNDGVHLHYGEEIDEFVHDNGVVRKIRLKSGMEIDGQCFGVGFGLTMNTELANDTGIELTRNGIVCNDELETSVKGIFAAGDIADFYDPILEMRYRMGTWNNAGAHGKVAAMNMMGANVKYDDVPEYSSLLFKGQTITQFGLSPEYRNDLETVYHVDPEKKWYRALYFWDGRVVGGVLLGKGNRSGKRRYVEAIKSKQRFPQAERRELLDWTHE
ncbi:MAG: NAD(P)/FAD-dependent oxidoreductase [Candidatus Eremiobacteraeota bacterium]|nr:NAD(P)/FAD-dependent oxidoreductase [Candidatus Eremiobacteraeota bacterium]